MRESLKDIDDTIIKLNIDPIIAVVHVIAALLVMGYSLEYYFHLRRCLVMYYSS